MVVNVEIEPSRHDAFLSAMKIDVEGSRTEPGCLRFDLLQDSSDPNKFTFYEVYTDKAAIDFHKQQNHFKAWADFKEEGGVVSLSATFSNGIDMS